MKKVLIALPVYNEEKILLGKFHSIFKYISRLKKYKFKICIISNGCTDSTPLLAESIKKKYPSSVSHIALKKKGRGNAVRSAWVKANEDILTYMDIDLSTKLEDTMLLIKGIEEGEDIVIGSRYLEKSKVERPIIRLLFSKAYNLLADKIFNNNISDYQCGFKAIKRSSAKEILPLIENKDWFFDTELIIKALNKGYKIKEIPITWIENEDSKVNLIRDSINFIKELTCLRLKL